MEPITREEQILAATSDEEIVIPVPITRQEKLLVAIYNKIGGGGIYGSPDSTGQTMTEYVSEHPEFWENIPEGTITRAQLADEVPEQIRDETMQPLSDEDITSMLDNIL